MRSLSSLPSGTFSQAPVPGTSWTPVEFEVAELADAHPGGAGEQERVGEQPVRGGFQGLADEPVSVGGQVAGQRPREFRDVAGEHERRAGASGGDSHSAMSARNRPRVMIRFRCSPAPMGCPLRSAVATAVAAR